VLGPVLMPKAGRRMAWAATSDHCVAVRILSMSLTFRGCTGAGSQDVGGDEEWALS
jgi:hypothetical protein